MTAGTTEQDLVWWANRQEIWFDEATQGALSCAVVTDFNCCLELFEKLVQISLLRGAFSLCENLHLRFTRPSGGAKPTTPSGRVKSATPTGNWWGHIHHTK